MAIDFADVRTNHLASVTGEEPYSSIESDLTNDTAEENVMLMIELLRSGMAELDSEEAARMLMYCVGRMVAKMPTNVPMYENLEVEVLGTDSGVATTAANGDTVDVTTTSGTDSVTLAAGPFSDLDAIVADINSQLVTATEVEAFNDNGRLGFRNTSGNIGVSFELDHGAVATSLLLKAGIEPGTYLNLVQKSAERARDDALAHFQRQGRPDDLS